jgi:hypothetical protein
MGGQLRLHESMRELCGFARKGRTWSSSRTVIRQTQQGAAVVRSCRDSGTPKRAVVAAKAGEATRSAKTGITHLLLVIPPE